MNSAVDSGGIYYHSRCNCSCISANYKYVRYRTLGDRLDIDHLSPDLQRWISDMGIDGPT